VKRRPCQGVYGQTRRIVVVIGHQLLWEGVAATGGYAAEVNSVVAGLVAGAVGTVALNVMTYADMAVRGRPSSDLPAKAADRWAQQLGVSLGDEQAAQNRRQGLGPLMGYVTGLFTGVGYGTASAWLGSGPLRRDGALLAVAAMIGSDASLVGMGLTDPREWGVSGWLADLLPHVAYGYAAAATYAAVTTG